MNSFYGVDPNLLISVLRLILDGFKTLRSEKGQPNPEKREAVLEEAIKKARELSAEGAGADTVASEIETKLERDLGTAGKDEIIRQATSILTLTQPFDLDAFRYYENLSKILTRAQAFCVASNIFRLRGTKVDNWNCEVLALPGTGPILAKLSHEFEVLTTALREQGGTIRARVVRASALLRTGEQTLHIALELDIEKPYSTGGSYKERKYAGLSLSPGCEVNRLGFDVIRPCEIFGLPDFDQRLTATEFRELVSAVLEDLNGYTKELADEEQDFRNQIAPVLDKILAEWTKL